MTKFEKAVELIAESYREDCEMYECSSIRELFRCWQMDHEDMVSDFWSVLHEKFDGDFTDDCEIIEDDNLVPFGRLVMAVRNYKFQ